MKSIIKLIGLLTILVLLFPIESSTMKRRNRSNRKSRVQLTPQVKSNYVASPSKVKYDYSKFDKQYKDEALKNNDVKEREKQLYEHTIRKVFKIFEVQDAAVDVCFKALTYPQLMHLMLMTFVDRAKDNTNDEYYLKNVKIYPPSCLEPLHKMKGDLAKKVNELKDAVYQFKKVQRRLRKLRKQRELELKNKKSKGKKSNKQ